MKRTITAVLCAAMLAGAIPAAVAENKYPELTLDAASPLVIADDGYIDNLPDGATAAELLANFKDKANVTVTSKSGDALTLTDKLGSDAVVSYASGNVTAKTWMLGDTNGDAAITLKDVSFLVKNQAGYGVDLCLRASDVNCDSAVNAKDVAQLLKCLAGWDVTIKKPDAPAEIAPDEDAGIGLYFTSIMNRVRREDVSKYGSADLIYRMAKNESETAEIILTSDADRGKMNLTVGALTNETGAVLETEVLYGYYYQMDVFNTAIGKDYDNYTSGSYVDPLVPLTGSFNLAKDQSMTFAVVINAPADAEPGFYKAPVTVTNEDGKTVKQATLRVYVWDFALDEDMSSCETSFGLSYSNPYYDLCEGKMENYGAREYLEQYDSLCEEWYEFMLDHDVSAYFLPYDCNSEKAQKYVHDPRVTSFISVSGRNGLDGGKTYDDVAKMYRAHRDDADWLRKAYIYTVDEPYRTEQFEYLDYQWETLSKLIPDIKFNVCTPLASNYYRQNDPDAIDLVDWISRSTNILCPQSYAFTRYTTREERVADPEKYPDYQGYGFTDIFTFRKYGQFEDRWEQFRNDGKRLWWYICCSPEFPYANFFNYYQGAYNRVVLWQQYLFHVDGLLYWDVAYWQISESNTAPISRRKTSNGDGLLVYPGSLFGMPGKPITSIRFECVRDGIEDFRYMRQLEEKLGRDAVLEYVERNTTAILQYTEKSDDITSTRDEMGFLLESLYN